jgi:flagellar hook-associated protein 1 FlgK
VKFSMAPNGTGGFSYTRLSDGAAMGDSMDGFQIAINGTPASDDSFELEPVGRAAVSMTRVLDDPAGIAAAVADDGRDGRGQQGHRDGRRPQRHRPQQRSDDQHRDQLHRRQRRLRVHADRLQRQRHRLGHRHVDARPADRAERLPAEPQRRAGQRRHDQRHKTAHPESNNGNALAMVALRDETFVGRDMQIDGTLQDGETATDAYASVLANVGVRVQSAKTASTISRPRRCRPTPRSPTRAASTSTRKPAG